MSRFSRSLLSAACVACFALPVSAHDMFLKATPHYLVEKSDAVLTLVSGTFDKSEYALHRSRMQDVSIVAHGARRRTGDADWFYADNTSFLKVELGAPGSYAVGVSTKPNIIELTNEAFDDYLAHDGVDDILAARKANPPTKGRVKERYSKHVRSLIQVGSERTDDYKAEFDYPVEIIVDQNPMDVGVGDPFGFMILVDGKPIENQIVRASYEGYHGHDDAGGHINAHKMRTDANGKAGFPIDQKGKWYLTLIHMVPLVDDDVLDYESNWATLTFEIR